MARDIAITQLAVFPVDGEVASEIPPDIVAAPESGTWTCQFALVDPYGDPRPGGGFWCSTSGPGIPAAEVFDVGFTMRGDAGDAYLLFAYDDEVDTWQRFPLHFITEAIPTVTGWGLAVTVLLLLVGGRIYFGRHRRAARQCVLL